MTKRTRVLIGLVVGALLLVSAPMVASADDDDRGSRGDLNVVGLTADTRLIEFDSDDPGDADTIGAVSGLTGDSTLVGIDYRPRNGKLYGLGNQGGIYTIFDRTAAATKVGQLTVALAGTSFGVDFNPAADALRIISDTGQNLRVPFAGGETPGATATDTSLTYPPAAGITTGVTGAGYTNNDNDPNTGTTLFDLDSMLDQAVIQSPANSGQLVATGKLGVDTGSAIGFDVFSALRKDTTVSVRAFASLTVDGRARFYRVNLLQGRAAPVGTFSTRNQVTGIAIQLDQSKDRDDD
jgi:Domain of unknown function (DUF4394)